MPEQQDTQKLGNESKKTMPNWLKVASFGFILVLIAYIPILFFNPFLVFSTALNIIGALGIAMFLGGLLYKPFLRLMAMGGHHPSHITIWYSALVILLVIGIPLVSTIFHNANTKKESDVENLQASKIRIIDPTDYQVVSSPFRFQVGYPDTPLGSFNVFPKITDSTGNKAYPKPEGLSSYQGVSLDLPSGEYTMSAWVVSPGGSDFTSAPIHFTVK